MAEIGPLDEFQRAQVEVLRARIAFATNRGSDAPPLLLAAARRLAQLDVPLARETYLDALTAALFNGRFAVGGGTNEVAAAALAAPPAPDPRPTDLLLDGLATLLAHGPSRGRPGCGAQSRRSRGATWNPPKRCAGDGSRVGRQDFIWDYEGWDRLTDHHIRANREAGHLAEVVLALTTRVGVHLAAGETKAAAALIEEADALARATGGGIAPRYAALALAAHLGREDELLRLARVATDDFEARGEGLGVTATHWVTALLYNGLARYEDALGAAVQATSVPGEIWFARSASLELIEAAARIGRQHQAAEALILFEHVDTCQRHAVGPGR